MRKKVIELLPDCRHYRSVFLGSGGLEFSIDPNGKSEIWNDYDGSLMNFYKVLQSPGSFKEFQRLCTLTLFSETEFEAAKLSSSVPFEYFGESVNRAWKYFIRNRFSRCGDGHTFAIPTARLRKGINENVSAWLSAVEGLPEFHKRLQVVDLRQMDFRYFIKKYDREDALFYCDPPYLPESRVAGQYELEMTEQDHVQLLDILANISGKFLLHGYNSNMYNSAAKLHGWNKTELDIAKSSSHSKEKPIATEVIWRNYV